MIAVTQTQAETFWLRIKKDANSDCWLWQGKIHSAGYGLLSINGHRQFAHRISYQRTHPNESIEGLVVCHHCDNPPCINPAHLFLGTPKDNIRDMIAKGRNAAAVHPSYVPRGADNPQARLTAQQVEEIRRIYITPKLNGKRVAGSTEPFSASGLARRFNVGKSTMWRIIKLLSYS
jgi:hypothetical protein